MHKAAQLSQRLEQVDVKERMDLIEKALPSAIHFDVLDDVHYIMHDDGSVNIIEYHGHGVMTGHVISAENILRVLHHYRPFSDLFKGNTQ
jgi:hypothetical protein